MKIPLPFRRLRFQFSLRTLLIGVLAIGSCWLVTLKYGAPALAEFQACKYLDFMSNGPVNPCALHNIVEFDRQKAGFTVQMQYKPSTKVRGHAYAAAPFVLLWRWETSAEDSDVYQATGDLKLRFWCPGFSKWEADNTAPSANFTGML